MVSTRINNVVRPICMLQWILARSLPHKQHIHQALGPDPYDHQTWINQHTINHSFIQWQASRDERPKTCKADIIHVTSSGSQKSTNQSARKVREPPMPLPALRPVTTNKTVHSCKRKSAGRTNTPNAEARHHPRVHKIDKDVCLLGHAPSLPTSYNNTTQQHLVPCHLSLAHKKNVHSPLYPGENHHRRQLSSKMP